MAPDSAARDERPRHVVLHDLGARLAGDALQVVAHLGRALLPLAHGLEVHVVEGHAPLEERHQHEVVERLEQVDRVPALVRVDPHDLVAEVLVLAADVRVRVVHVVVGVLPGLLGGRGVPVPGRGVDVRVVHPVPLAVHHVVADLHVLEDLGHRQGGRAGDPARPVARSEQQRAAEQRQAPLERDDRADVGGVALAEAGEHLVVDRLELLAELLDLLRGEAAQRALDFGHGLAGHGHAIGPFLSTLTARSPRVPRVRSRRSGTRAPRRRSPRRCAGRAPCPT